MLPDADINYGVAALALTRDFVPGFDVARGASQLDAITARVRQLLSAQPDQREPMVRIAAINTVLYREYGFHYDMSDFPEQSADKRLLGNLLRRGQGTCANLPDLYYAVAERLGFPIYLVEAPQHIFLRYELSDGEHINIEATSGGGQSPDADYIAEMEIPRAGLNSGTFMRTLSRREALLVLVQERTWHAQRAGDLEQVLALDQFLRRQRPNHAPTLWNSAISSVVAGRATRELAKKVPAFRPVTERYFAEARAFAAQATEFGITEPDNVGEYVQRQESIRRSRLGEGSVSPPPSPRWDANEEIERLIAAPPSRALDWATAMIRGPTRPMEPQTDSVGEFARRDDDTRSAEWSSRAAEEARVRTEALIDAVDRLSRSRQGDERLRLINEIAVLTRTPSKRIPFESGAHP